MGRGLGIDLGTATTRVYAGGQGVVVREPSVVALDGRSGEVVAFGREAEELLGRGPGHVRAVRPLRHGAIVDFDVTHRLLRLLLEGARARRAHRARVVVCVPSSSTDVERRAVEEAARRAGAGDAWLLEHPVAAALGLGLPLDQALGTMVVGVGAGISETAVLSLGGVVTSRSARVGTFDLDAALRGWLRRSLGVDVPERTAEEIRRTAGTAAPVPDEVDVEVQARDVASGRTVHVEVAAEEVRAAMAEPLTAICGTAVSCLGATPPDLVRDVMQQGIHLVGGGALLAGLDRRVADETGLPVHHVDRPLDAAVLGAGRCVESDDVLDAVCASGGPVGG